MLKRVRRLIDTIHSLAEAEKLLSQLAGALLAPGSEDQIIISNLDAYEEPIRASLIVDDGGKIVWLDEGAEFLLGRRSSAVIGCYFNEFLLPRDRGRRAVPDNNGARMLMAENLMVLQAHGPEISVRASCSEFRISGAAAFAISLKAAPEPGSNRHGRMALAHYRALVEQIPAVTFMAAFDASLAQLYVSPQIENLLGFTQREWLEDPILWFRQLHPDDLEIVHREFARGVSTGGPFRAELRVYSRDRRIVWVRGEARVVRDKDGTPLFFQGIVFDITEAKHAEEQLRELHEANLRSERLAAVGRVAASVSHDLRNPLGSIRNAWYYLRRKIIAAESFNDDPRIRRFSDVIEQEITRCSTIIGDLLDFTREPPLERAHISILSLVQRVRLEVPIPASVKVVDEIASDLPTIYVDSHRFGQALINLLENAVDAVDLAGGIISIKSRLQGDQLLIEIGDNGAGISLADQQRIFEPLFTTKMRGTGLGLSIVSNIVKRHGGTINVRSSPGVGTTFSIAMPLG